MSTRIVDSGRLAESSTSVMRMPMWIAAGQVGVIAAVFIGFGTNQPVRPTFTIGILAAATLGTILLGPVGGVRRILLSVPTVALMAWWFASILWTYNTFGWRRETQLNAAIVASLIVIGSLIPLRSLQRALVTACYLAIGYSVFYTIVHFSFATMHPDGTAGWRAGFGHKNGLGPFMVFALLVLLSFERPRPLRHVAVVVSLAFVLLSQSTSAFAAGLVLAALAVGLTHLSHEDKRWRALTITVGSVITVSMVWLIATFLPQLLDLRGKDTTLSRRTDIWERVWQAITERPWTGYGIGGVWIDQGAEPTRTMMSGLGFTVFHSHSGMLEVLLQIGIVGLLLYSWLLLSTIVVGMRVLFVNQTLGRFVLLYILLMMILAITEVTVFTIWLGLLAMLNVVAARELRTRVLEHR